MKKTNKIVNVAASRTVRQEMDCCGEDDNFNYLDIKTHDSGGGTYLVLKTDRWAIDPKEDLEEFILMLRETIKMVEED